jgi:hypothetical protein
LHAAVLERGLRLAADQAIGIVRKCDTARRRTFLDAHRKGDALTEPVGIVDDHVAHRDPDAKADRADRKAAGTVIGERLLEENARLDGVDDAAEFKQRAVAEHLEQRAAEARQARRDHLAENAVERRQRVRLVLLDVTVEANEIQGDDRGEAALGLVRRRPFQPPQNGADTREQLAQFPGLCQIIVGAHFESDDTIDRACRRREHDHRNGTGLLQIADDRQPVFLRHVQIEHDEIGLLVVQLLPQTGAAAVAERDLETMHAEIFADHFAGVRLVVDDKDARQCSHGLAITEWARRQPVSGAARTCCHRGRCCSRQKCRRHADR